MKLVEIARALLFTGLVWFVCAAEPHEQVQRLVFTQAEIKDLVDTLFGSGVIEEVLPTDVRSVAIPIPIHFENETLEFNITVNTSSLDLPLSFVAETVNAINLSITSKNMSLPLIFEAEQMKYNIGITSAGDMPLSVHINEASNMPLQVSVTNLVIPVLDKAMMIGILVWCGLLTISIAFLCCKTSALNRRRGATDTAMCKCPSCTAWVPLKRFCCECAFSLTDLRTERYTLLNS
eukprot:ANDGO_03578.mRNA.1 hypothetical protein